MTARLLLVVLLTGASVAAAVEFPDAVAASKCKGKKKVFGFIDDPTSSPTVRKIKMSNAFFVQAGSAFVQGCRTARGSDTCVETFGVGLFLYPGLTGEMPCGAQSGLPYINYSLMPADGGTPSYWTNTGNCTVTVVRYDEERGRLAATYRTQVVNSVGDVPIYGGLVGCFKAKRQSLN
jgi:hypothetical protein